MICAGDALVQARETGSGLRAGGGAIHAALSLAEQGLRVGLATVLADDTSGRALRAKIAASGVDVGGVQLATPRSELLFVRGGARQVVSAREMEQPIAMPTKWSSRVLLLSGVSPVVSHGAALCRAARAARRAGTITVVDMNADWHLWKGRDPRALRMVLREADVVRCSAQDLFGINMDVHTLRSALRTTAVLVSSDGAGRATATGPFGEVAHALPARATLIGEGDAFNVAICAELARVDPADEGGGALWARALRAAHEAIVELRRRM